MRSILGVACFIGVVVGGILYGTPLSIFLDLPSLLIVLGTTLSLTISKHSFTDILSFSDEVVMSLINFSLMGGGIGFIVGLVQMFQNMSDPSLIGPAIAVSMLSTFYSLIIAAALYAYKKQLNTRRVGIAGLVGGVVTLIPVLMAMASLSDKT